MNHESPGAGPWTEREVFPLPRTIPSAPRRGRPPAASPESLSRERVVAAALEELDASGLAAFSIREVARRLGVYPAAVYWHVSSRNNLLSDMVAAVLAEVAPVRQPGARWQDWLAELFRRTRAAIRRHPAIAPLIGAQLVSNAGVDFVMIERLLEVLGEAGFAGTGLVEAFNTVVAAEVGFVTMEFAPLPAEGRTAWAETMQGMIGSVDPQRFPRLAAALPAMANRSFMLRWQNGTEVPMDRPFEAYVATVIAGLEARIRVDLGKAG